jgi:ABC-type methionine transport system ATPase subunit
MKIKAELIFPIELKDEATLCYLCKQFNIVLNIIEASFSTEVGWAIVVVEGEEAEIKKALEYLLAKSVEVKNTQIL